MWNNVCQVLHSSFIPLKASSCPLRHDEMSLLTLLALAAYRRHSVDGDTTQYKWQKTKLDSCSFYGHAAQLEMAISPLIIDWIPND